MKKLLLIVFLVAGIATQAQEQKTSAKEYKKEQMSPEQKDQLRLKKLTIDLNLTPAQQKEMGKLVTEQREKREKMKTERKASKAKGLEMTADQRFERKNKMLDEQKELKEKIQKILDADQFKKWEEMRNDNREAMKERIENRTEKKLEQQ